uniref:Ig-like domain-containing protein n=1 Tax=Cyprinus carpio carpio TaxID=630221 RepID=A0A9J8DJY9_CYPCA
MKNALCLLLLSFSLQRIKCQSMESTESTVQKKPGETLTLSCRGSGFSFGCCSMHLIRQQAGKPLVWMGRVYSDSSGYDYSESFKGRTEVNRDNSKSMVYLKLSGLTAEDSAVYYCAKQAQLTIFQEPFFSIFLCTSSQRTQNELEKMEKKMV